MNPISTLSPPPASCRVSRLALVIPGTILLGSALAGCGGYSIREGIWELKVDSFTNLRNGQVLEVPVQQVKVAVVGVKDEKNPEHIEDVEISPWPPLDSEEARKDARHARQIGRRPFFADILQREDGPTLFVVSGPTGRDETYVFQMRGVVKDSETIVGQNLTAKILYTSDATFQGRWSMRWLRDQ